MQAARLITLMTVSAAAYAHVAQAEDGQAAACRFEKLGTFAAGPVTDGRTFRLQDGREVRLAGIEALPSSSAGKGGAQALAATAAKAALEELLSGSHVILKNAESSSDRYGHLVAHAFVTRAGRESWVQQEMMAAGHARVGSRLGPAPCAAALLASESAARQAKLGLWADPYYAIKPADDAAALLSERGRFVIAEGKVLSVRESGGTIYINFGRVWSRNLTVTILRRNKRAFAAAGLKPEKLEGRRARVRGWVEERGGPQIEAARPEQIEIVD